MQYQLNNPDGNVIDRWKYTAGAEYKISKKFGIDVYYRLAKAVNVKNPANISILGTSLKFQF
jgi:long-subunit fatty acid transport protein